MRKENIERRLKEIFGKESGQETEKAATKENIVEKTEEMSKRETPFENRKMI